MAGGDDWIEDIGGRFEELFFLLGSLVAESWTPGSTQCSNTQIFIMDRPRRRDPECDQRESNRGGPTDEEKDNLYDHPNQLNSSEFVRG